MKYFRIPLIAFFICSEIAIGQTDTRYYLDIPSASQDQVFENTLRLLLEGGYFIQSLDKDTGLIR